jgi:hypothetical protein
VSLLDIPPCRPCPAWDLLASAGYQVHGAEWTPDGTQTILVVSWPGEPEALAFSEVPYRSYRIERGDPALLPEWAVMTRLCLTVGGVS